MSLSIEMPPRRAKSPSARSNEKQTNLSAFDVSADDGSLLHSHFGEATAAPAPTNKKGGGILSELSSVFLPEGYPRLSAARIFSIPMLRYSSGRVFLPSKYF